MSPKPSPPPPTSAVGPEGDPDLVLPQKLPFKKTPITKRYPKGQNRPRFWKNLKQIMQVEDFLSLSPGQPNYLSIESPPSMYPAKKYCDITGFQAPYTDPHTKLRFADMEVFWRIRHLPNETVQALLALRNANVVLK